MNVTGLRAFHAVAQAGSFTRAAASTGLSQPTLSSQVRLLEAQHDASLFDRRGRGATLTELGQQLFDVTTRLFAAEDDARALLEGTRTLRRGHLRIAADSATHVMPVLAALRGRIAGLTFSLKIDNSTNVLQQLLDYGADIAIGARNTSDPRIHSMFLRHDRLVLFVLKTHPLAKHSSIPASELAGQNLVVRERGSITREVFETALATADVKPGELVEIQGREAVRETVAAGFGIGIVFESEFPADPAFHTLDVTGVDLTVTEYAACLEARRRVPMVRRFLDLVREKAQLPAAAAGA